jgi:hypothetical protein
LRDTAFIAMSNYYYEEKPAYLDVLAEVRSKKHDLTPFLVFGLKGVAVQCERLFLEIKRHIQVAVFRDLMYSLFNRLRSSKRRVIKDRQIAILKLLLDGREMELPEIIDRTTATYGSLLSANKAIVRDLNELMALGAIHIRRDEGAKVRIAVNLDWPQQITEGDFMERIKQLPKSKMHQFL